MLGLVSRWRSPKAAMPNAKIAVGTSCGDEVSTASEANALTAATDAHGVQPKSSLSPFPGRGRYVASVVAQASVPRATSAVHKGAAARAHPPDAATDSANITGASKATAVILRIGHAALALAMKATAGAAPESVLSIERIKSSICDHLFQRVHSSLAQ